MTLSGSLTFATYVGGPAEISGAGTLVATGSATQLTASVLVDEGATFLNSGGISATANLNLGDGSALAGHFVNAATGVYDIVNDAGIGIGSSLASDFTNYGLFEKTGRSTGTTYVNAPFVNNGTIEVTTGSGTIDFVGGFFGSTASIIGVTGTDANGNFTVHG